MMRPDKNIILLLSGRLYPSKMPEQSQSVIWVQRYY